LYTTPIVYLYLDGFRAWLGRQQRRLAAWGATTADP
jgi:hypothetical protein